MTGRADVLVIGGGPSGLAAATALRRRGASVVLAEREAEPGGVPRHCAHSPFGMREFGRILSGRRYGERLAEVAVQAGVDLRTRCSAVRFGDDLTTLLTSPDGPMELKPRFIVVATGIRETSRAARLLSGDRPLGVLTTGALQDYVHLRGLVPFRRPVVVGSELVTLSAMLTCRSAGIAPVAMVEDEPAPRVGYPAALLPALLGIPVGYRTHIVDILGRGRVEAVVLRDARGGTRTVDCDGVLLTGRFTPESSLARLAGLSIDSTTGGPAIDAAGRTSHPRIYAAGNVRRAVKTAGRCWSEGRDVARVIATALERER